MKTFECSSVLGDKLKYLKDNVSKRDWNALVAQLGQNGYIRITKLSNTKITIDYGSWSHFLGIEGTEEEIRDLYPELFED